MKNFDRGEQNQHLHTMFTTEKWQVELNLPTRNIGEISSRHPVGALAVATVGPMENSMVEG